MQNHIKYKRLCHDVHIWYCVLDTKFVTDNFESFLSYLMPHEQKRVNSYKDPVVLKKMTASKALTRVILASHLGIPLQELQIASSPNGKPFVVGYDKLDFSVSHSNHVFMLAIGWFKLVGIDVEDIRGKDYTKLVSYVLSNNEQRIYYQSHVLKREKVFLSFWTRKEAFLKCKGTGVNDTLFMLDTCSFTQDKMNESFGIFQCDQIEVNCNAVAHAVVLPMPTVIA